MSHNIQKQPLLVFRSSPEDIVEHLGHLWVMRRLNEQYARSKPWPQFGLATDLVQNSVGKNILHGHTDLGFGLRATPNASQHSEVLI